MTMRMMMVTGALALLAAACGGEKTEDATPGDSAGSIAGPGAIAPPIPEDVTTRIGASEDGGTVEVRVGEKISVALSGVPTAGYVWFAVEAPDFLTPAGEASGPTSTAQLEPGFAGGNHWEVFFYDVAAVGSGLLRFEQRRPWEDESDPANASFSVTVTASTE